MEGQQTTEKDLKKGSWGAEGASAKDLQLPRLSVGQALSQSVKDDLAKPGEIVNGQTGKVLAKRGEAVNFIPFFLTREWWEMKKPPGSKRFSKMVGRFAVTPQNESLPGKDVKDGEEIERNLTISVYAMVEGQLDEFPHVLVFQRSSLKSGRFLSSEFMKAQFKGNPPAMKKYSFSSKPEAKDGNDYFVAVVKEVGLSTPEELEKAFEWYETLNGVRQKAMSLAAGKTPEALAAAASEALPPPASASDEEVPF